MVVHNLGQTSPSPGSPTARLLLEYEQHLRNTLAKGMDAESYSLHTFVAIICPAKAIRITISGVP